MIWFCLFLMAVPQSISSTRVNTTASDGKVVVTGNHNEVIVSATRESKIALAQIKSRLGTMGKKDEEFSKKLQALDERMLALDKVIVNLTRAMERTNQTLSQTVEETNEEFSRKLKSLDKRVLSLESIQGSKMDSMNQTVKTLSNTVQSLNNNIGTMNKSNAGLFAQVQANSQRVSALERQVTSGYALLFPRKGTSDYVITRGMPSLKAVTVCLWMKTADKGNAGTPLSYAVSRAGNELLLHDYRKFDLYLGDDSRQTSVSANDGKWHHICTTWENTAGSWKLYKDGKIGTAGKGFKTGHVIRRGGALVLGQEQDKVGGAFDASQSFIGELAGVNIWDHVKTEQEIMRMSKSCLAWVGNVFQWRDFKPHVRGSVKTVKPSC